MAGEYSKGYLKGYEEGLSEAWHEIIRWVRQGYDARELRIRAQVQLATINQRIESKKRKGLEVHKATYPQDFGTTMEKKIIPTRGEYLSTPLTLREGTSYLIRESMPDKSFKLFSKIIMDQRAKGMCITRTNPNTIKTRYNIGDSKVVRLSATEFFPKVQSPSLPPSSLGLGVEHAIKESEDYISPTNLENLSTRITNFLDQNANNRGVILLDGLEYLITQNNFNSILRFIQHLNDTIIAKKSYFILPVDPGTMEDREFKILAKDMGQII